MDAVLPGDGERASSRTWQEITSVNGESSWITDEVVASRRRVKSGYAQEGEEMGERFMGSRVAGICTRYCWWRRRRPLPSRRRERVRGGAREKGGFRGGEAQSGGQERGGEGDEWLDEVAVEKERRREGEAKSKSVGT